MVGKTNPKINLLRGSHFLKVRTIYLLRTNIIQHR